MIRNFFLTFLRSFKRHSSYMIINVVGLALGIMVACLILLFVADEMSYDKFNQNYEKIYRLETEDWALAGTATGGAIANNIPGIRNFVRLDNFGFYNSLVSWKEVKTRIPDFVLADTSFFSIFSIKFLEGDPRTALTDPCSAVLTESMAKNIFGKSPAMGQTIRVKNQWEFTVTGIIEDPRNFHIPIQLIAPFEVLRKVRSESYMNQFGGWNHPTYFLLEEGVDPQKVQKDANAFLSNIPRFKGKNPQYRLRPLKDLYFANDIRYEALCKHGNKDYVFLFMAIAVLILLIGIINFVNLTTARAPLRAKEVGVRKVFGGDRRGLVLMFLGESLCFSILAFGIAFWGVSMLVPYLNNLMGSQVALDFYSESSFWLAYLPGIVLVGGMAGVYPAFVLSSFNSLEAFKSNGGNGSGGIWFRRLLILFQFSVSIILIIFTLTIHRQIYFLQNRDLGMRTDRVVYCRLNKDIVASRLVFKERLMKLPQVEGVAISEAIPGRIKHQRTWPVSPDEGVQYTYVDVEPEFADVMGLQFMEGRNFSWDNEAERGGMAVLLNETAVKAFGLTPPFVKSYQLPGYSQEMRVIGVIKDFHYNSLHQPIAPLVITWTQYGNNYVSIRLSGRNMSQTLKQITSIWDELSPGFPFEYQFLDESFAALYQKEGKFAQLFILFSLLAILIATLGLFGLAAFTTHQRKKEIGVRKVLGASDNVIVRLLLSEFGRWVVLAGFIAMPVSWWGISQWLRKFPYHMEVQIWIFGAGWLICIAIAMLTVSYHTYRAANLNPVDAIQYE